uniref:Uncharacterized protein n=1 Tax=Gouania willdenowi TaxID=441366 RepID=A0A8C5N7W6_GOUWI
MSEFYSLLLQRLYEQREMDFLCDVTIAVRDAEFRAHRNVLSAFSSFFCCCAERGENLTSLEPDNVSRYALEKLLEFVYTGHMNLSRSFQYFSSYLQFASLSCVYACFRTRQAAVRRAAVFLGMPEAIKYLEESPHWSEPGEGSQPDDVDPSQSSSAPSPASPVPLSIAPPTWTEEGEECAEEPYGREEEDEGVRSDEDFSPTVTRGSGRKRGRKPKSFSGEGGAKVALRGRGRGRGRGRPRGRGRGVVRKEEEELDSDTSVKDCGDNSADWKGEDLLGNGEGPLECSQCNKEFKDHSSLRRHEKIHESLKPFSCIFCSKTFRQATQLKTHLRIHTGENATPSPPRRWRSFTDIVRNRTSVTCAGCPSPCPPRSSHTHANTLVRHTHTKFFCSFEMVT